MDSVRRRLGELKTKVARKRSEYDLAKKVEREERASQTTLHARLANLASATSFVQTVAETVQKTCHQRIASVVSRCLETVFGDDAYQFEIDFNRKRGKTEASIYLTKDGMRLEPMDAVGGGVIDVASFALRLASIVSSTKSKIIILDEPFKHLSRNLHDRTRTLIESLSKDMEIQFILVTHSEPLRCGKIVEITSC